MLERSDEAQRGADQLNVARERQDCLRPLLHLTETSVVAKEIQGNGPWMHQLILDIAPIVSELKKILNRFDPGVIDSGAHACRQDLISYRGQATQTKRGNDRKERNARRIISQALEKLSECT